jgi:hypothetical protein
MKLFKDLAKGIPLLVLAAAPGGVVAIFFLAKFASKKNINLWPSVFKKKFRKTK